MNALGLSKAPDDETIDLLWNLATNGNSGEFEHVYKENINEEATP